MSFPLEAPVSIYLDSRLTVTVACTPSDLEALAAGFLYGERLIPSADAIKSIEAAADARRGQVWVSTSGTAPPPEGRTQITSGCGRGKSFLCADDVDALEKAPPGLPFSTTDLICAASKLRSEAVLRNTAGAAHAALLLSGSGKSGQVAEDIGRHNAVDKAVGAMLLSKTDPRGCAIVTTGRVSSELVLKAAVVGCPVVVSMRGATHLAIEIARKLDMAIVAYLRGESMDVCSGRDRICETAAN